MKVNSIYDRLLTVRNNKLPTYVEEAISFQLLHDHWDQNCKHGIQEMHDHDKDDNYQGLTHYGRGNTYPREHCQ